MLSKLSIAIFLVLMSYFAYNKTGINPNNNSINDFPGEDKSSIYISGGKYKIDSSVIRKDLNKRRLLGDVETENLSIRKTFEEVPDFIRDFLVKNSYNGKFDIVNPGEEWKSTIADFGHTIITKHCDPVTKDTILTIKGDGAILPNKQFVYCGIGKSIAVFSYYAAGYQNPMIHWYDVGAGGWNASQNVVLLKFKEKKVVDFWYRGYNYDNISTEGDTLQIRSKSEIIKILTLKSKNTGGC